MTITAGSREEAELDFAARLAQKKARGQETGDRGQWAKKGKRSTRGKR